MTALAPAVPTLKEKLQATWSCGNYALFATYMEPGARQIFSDWLVEPGEKFLDVACGSGQLAIPAAENGVIAAGVDISGDWLAAARRRAAAAGLLIHFREGDAEALPFADSEFDTVASMFGAMFAPNPERVVAELARVCRSDGRILMANWTAESFVGHMFKTVGAHVGAHAPSSADMPSPLLWGDPQTVARRFGDIATELEMEKRSYPLWHYPFAVSETVEFFRQNYGPIQKAFAALDGPQQAALRRDLEGVFTAFNQATDGTTLLDGEYLEVAVRRV